MDDRFSQKTRASFPTCSVSINAFMYIGVSENVVYPIVPNGFADHCPYEKLLFHWEYTLFSVKPI